MENPGYADLERELRLTAIAACKRARKELDGEGPNEGLAATSELLKAAATLARASGGAFDLDPPTSTGGG